MIEPTLSWLIALASLAALGLLAAAWWWRSRSEARPKPLPSEWSLTPRPVFNSEERRLYRQLREALPNHIVLAKLPLVRFCQPADPQDVRYWYDLLGATHVTFAVCSAHGRVLAAIDFDTDRSGSRRTLQIKQAVLGACRIRYLRCPVDHLPSEPELQLLVPQAGTPSRHPQATPAALMTTPAPPEAGDTPSTAVAPRRRRRATLWQDSGLIHDSFFGLDSRIEANHPSEFSPFAPPPPAPRRTNGGDGTRMRSPQRPQRDIWSERDDDDIPSEPPRFGASGGR